MTSTLDLDETLTGFDFSRDRFLDAFEHVPTLALGYLKPGDEYSLAGLTVHVNYVLEHYSNVLDQLVAVNFGECRPSDPDGLEAGARERARSHLERPAFDAEITRLRQLHEAVRARLLAIGEHWTRKADVFYGDAPEAFPTSAADVLGWLKGHYEEHVPHIAGLTAEWAGATAGSEAVEIVNRFNERFGAGDVDGIMALMTDDCLFENTLPAPDGTVHRGQEAVRTFWADFFAQTANPRFETEDVFASGDRVCARWRFHWGPPGGENSGHVRGVDVFRVRDGKVAEKLSYVKG